MNILKYIGSIAIGLLVAVHSVFAASEADINKLKKEYVLNQDGSMEFRESKELKLNTHNSFNGLYGETFIVYNPHFQEVKFHHSYSRQADGNIVQTPENAFNEVLPNSAANAPAYNHLKEMVVTHTGLELGATIYLDYSVLTKSGYVKELDIDEILQELSPVKEYTIIVDVPASHPVNYALTGSNVKPWITQQGNRMQYTWVLKNIPASNREPYSTYQHVNVPRLTVSTYPSQNAALETFRNNLNTNLNREGVAFTQELVKNSATEAEKIYKIQDFVTRQIARIGLDMESTGYQNRTPDDVLHTSYGTKTEITGLFVAMLKAINCDPQIAVVYPATLKQYSKGLKPIEDLLVKVNVNNRPVFLSASSSSNGSIELRGAQNETWLVSANNITPLTIIGSKAAIGYTANIRIDDKKAVTSGSAEISSVLLPHMAPQNTDSHVKGSVHSAGKISESEVTYNSANDAKVNFKAEKEIRSDQNYIIYKLPEIQKGVTTWQLQGLTSSRKNLMEIPYPITENYQYDITLAPGMTLKTKDHQVEINKPVGSVKILFKQEGDKLRVNRSLQLNKSILTPAEYQDFKKIMEAWINKNNNNVLIGI